jgi:Tfp pilus assembly protein PilF
MVFALLLTFTASSFATERADNAIQQSSAAQKEELARGISLYEQGDYKGAIESLRAVLKERDKNSEAWHYLGLALIRVGDIERRTAFERGKVASLFCRCTCESGLYVICARQTARCRARG